MSGASARRASRVHKPGPDMHCTGHLSKTETHAGVGLLGVGVADGGVGTGTELPCP